MIETLFLAGADIFRLNFSHGSQEQKLELLKMIREVEEKYSHPIAVLGDLQGPKLRVSADNCFCCDTNQLHVLILSYNTTFSFKHNRLGNSLIRKVKCWKRDKLFV